MSQASGSGAVSAKRVLHVMWTLEIGGAERALYQLVLAQRESGIDAGVLVASDLGLYGDRLVAQGIEVETLGQRRGLDLAASVRARAIFARWDAVHFHVAEPLLMLMAALGPAKLYYTHRAGAFHYGVSRKLRYKAAGTIVRRRFAGIVGNTAHAGDVAAALFAVPRTRVGVVYNGIDWSILRAERDRADVQAEVDVRPDSFLIGTSANLRDCKRIDMVIRTLPHVPKNAVFVIVGDGPERGRLEKLARELGVQERVRFIGKRANVADFLQLLDVFVLPSGPEESFGNAAVEAMGWGLPTIVLQDGGGLVEHIVHGETGVVATNEDDMSGWITRLAGDEALRRSIGARARDAVRQVYSVERMVSAYAALYAGTG